jgi:glycosidase
MPDLNHDNPRVREAIIDVGKWWLTQTGIDGFRLDAANTFMIQMIPHQIITGGWSSPMP